MSGRLICAFIFDGEAVAKGRPRFTTRGGFGRTYTPQRTVDFEIAIGLHAQLAMRGAGGPACEEPVSVRIAISRKPPRSWSRKRREAALGQPITGRPDLDNQAKAILDGLNTVAFLDDAQVASLSVERRWSKADLISVEVWAYAEQVAA